MHLKINYGSKFDASITFGLAVKQYKLFDSRWQTLKAEKGGSPMSKTWGFFIGGSEHGAESSCQISAYYKFFPGFNVFCRISTGL